MNSDSFAGFCTEHGDNQFKKQLFNLKVAIACIVAVFVGSAIRLDRVDNGFRARLLSGEDNFDFMPPTPTSFFISFFSNLSKVIQGRKISETRKLNHLYSVTD